MLQVSRVKANGPSKNKEGLIREPRPIYNGQKKFGPTLLKRGSQGAQGEERDWIKIPYNCQS